MKKINLFLIVIISTNFSLVAFSQCTDTVHYVPSVNKIVNSDCKITKEGHSINDFIVDEDSYRKFTRMKDSINRNRLQKERYGCYIILFDNDSIKLEEGHFFSECYKGLYKNYHKNGNIKEEGEFSKSKYCAKTGRWLYYNESGNLIRE